METRAGAQIQARAFFQSFVILLVFMLLSGALTRVLPAGSYTRVIIDGREQIVPDSYEFSPAPDYPIWRWFTAPIEVLFTDQGVVVITIILFILMVGSSFAVLDRSGILVAVIVWVVERLGGRKYILLLVISLAFMALGAFFGIFEEVIPLIPIMLALAYTLGWDTLVGLGMSILATNIGFTAAITNPFTIGVAQQIAGLPLFSGAGLRVLIFIVMYAIYAVFIIGYARRIDRKPELSAVYIEDQQARARYAHLDPRATRQANPQHKRAIFWFLACLCLILLVLISGPVFPAISGFALPLVGILFLSGGVGAGRVSGLPWRSVFRALWEGLVGIAPGIVLILMAVSIQYIVTSGGVLDTILYRLSQPFERTTSFTAAAAIYFLALLIEFFVGSGSAKAFLMMPVLLPLADLVGVTRQTAVLAYCFGDGFSNLMYPTNPVLLIALGLTVVSYPRWFRWTLRLWVWVVLASLVFLGLAVLINYGPF